MPKKSVKKYMKNKRRSKRSYKRVLKGGTNFPTVDNVIPYNKDIGLAGDPIDPSTIISGRNWVGGKKRRLSKKFLKKMEMKKKGGSIFNYDLLTGASFQDNAVQSLNTSSGTQNTLDKVMGTPQETGPTLSYNRMPDSALV
jgi:Na+-translocating ferredoxin:NAD+ oxidoreductase RnfG subunit